MLKNACGTTIVAFVNNRPINKEEELEAAISKDHSLEYRIVPISQTAKHNNIAGKVIVFPKELDIQKQTDIGSNKYSLRKLIHNSSEEHFSSETDNKYSTIT